MPEEITDVTEFLASLVSQYESSVDNAYSRMSSDIDLALDQSKQVLLSIPHSVEAFISAHPVKSNVDSTSFRTSIASLKTGVQTVLDNLFTQAASGYYTRKDNARIDFNQALNDAQDAFQLALNSSYITDTDYHTKYTDASTSISDYTNETVARVSDKIAFSDSLYYDTQATARADAAVLFSDYVFNRPLMRNVGGVVVPTTPKFDGVNDFGIDLQNVGRKRWDGWLGITVTDEYYKKYVQNDRDNTFFALPGQFTHVTKSITIPKAITVTDKTTGNPVKRNWGKNITYKISINTVMG